MEKLGARIRDLRSQKNITQEQLAQRLHVTRQAISNWENEKTQPDLQTLQQLAQALDISAEELIYGKQEKKYYLLPKREEDFMFENIGGKLKKLASILTWIGCILSLLAGFIYAFPIGLLLITPIGCLLSWVGSFALYGFGQLIENSDRCVDLLTRAHGIPETEEASPTQEPLSPREPWICYSCGEENSGRVSYCVNCGTNRGWSDMKWEQEQAKKENP